MQITASRMLFKVLITLLDASTPLTFEKNIVCFVQLRVRSARRKKDREKKKRKKGIS